MPGSRLASLPAAEAARRLALGRLAEAGAAAWRLSDPDDAEALHDFRVALRRLRALLRALEEPLAGRAGKRWQRRLARLADATGEGRDAEVALAWVESERSTLPAGQRPGAVWLAAVLAQRTEQAYAGVRNEVQAKFAPLAERLRVRLARPEEDRKRDLGKEEESFGVKADEGDEGAAAESPGDLQPGADGDVPARRKVGPSLFLPSSSLVLPPSFGLVLAEALREHLASLRERLLVIAGPEDVEPAHRARIAGKRLRYLLETVSGEVAGAGPAVARLKGLQDLLGELHDAHVLEVELPAAAERAAAETARALAEAAAVGGGQRRRRWTEVAGVLALIERNRVRRDRLFAGLAAEWLGEGKATVRLAEAVEAVAARLEGRAAAASGGVRSAPRAAADLSPGQPDPVSVA